jgi:hypothetical protein
MTTGKNHTMSQNFIQEYECKYCKVSSVLLFADLCAIFRKPAGDSKEHVAHIFTVEVKVK